MSIPRFFYINGNLHEKLAVIKSDSKVMAFCFYDEEKVMLPLVSTTKLHKKAFTITEAAQIMNVSPFKIRDLFKTGLYKKPEHSYHLSTMRPKKAYICEDDMLNIRQLLWDLLPKNRYGVPYQDTMSSAEDVIHAMRQTDGRDYVKVEGDMVRIYRA